jgi:hypothetical protein
MQPPAGIHFAGGAIVKHPVIRLDESALAFHYREWRKSFIDNPKPGSTPPTYIQYLELIVNSETDYRLIGKDLLKFIKSIGGRNEKAPEEEK